jgi:hypothetical protein
VFQKFVARIRQGYNDNPYHNWHHGCDVAHTTYLLLLHSHASAYMSKLEISACLIAALAHDVNHPGVNNGFLVKTKHELALLHNDKSPLENMHAAALYEIMRDDSCNILKHLSDEDWTDCRKQILTCILNTDMAVHFQNVKELEMFEELQGQSVVDFMGKYITGDMPSPPPCLENAANRLLIQHTFLHAADLSNPVKATSVYEKWVKRVTDEFFNQGDTEKGLGLPISPMCDRATTKIPGMQLGFIDFVIAPFYINLFKLFPVFLKPMAENLKNNYFHYADKHMVDASAEEVEKTKKRKEGLSGKLKFALEASFDN